MDSVPIGSGADGGHTVRLAGTVAGPSELGRHGETGTERDGVRGAIQRAFGGINPLHWFEIVITTTAAVALGVTATPSPRTGRYWLGRREPASAASAYPRRTSARPQGHR